jgi:WhiB family redox-sensing transcriptional regulator
MKPLLFTPASIFRWAADWRRHAACRNIDPELFFPVSSSGQSMEQEERAKAVCRSCTVRRQCLEYAIAAHEAFGVWGGTTADERTRAHVRPDRPVVTKLGG